MCVFKKEIWRYPHTPDNTQNTLYKQERNLLVRRLLQNGNCKMMKIVKTRLEKRLPEILTVWCSVYEVNAYLYANNNWFYQFSLV